MDATPIRSLNILGLLGISAVLAVAFFYQLAFGDLPCPLCLLQRGAFVAVGLGFLLNIRFGSSPTHYGVILVSAVIGAGTALRQVLLHIKPGDAGYGLPFLGLHFYTWALIAFIGCVLHTGLLLFLEAGGRELQRGSGPAGRLAAASAWLFVLLVAGNLVSTMLECRLGPCADNPVFYDMLHS
jgi:disulfide bond formation protein DsbB